MMKYGNNFFGNNSQFTYSNSIINFILEEIKKDPQNLIKNLKEIIKKQQKKDNPRSKGILDM